MQYSHSRLSTFEQCKLKFKYKYLDQLEGDIENTIEAFMGSRVHEVLEKLYDDLKAEKHDSLADLLEFYETEWDRHYTSDILVVKEDLNPEHYRALGRRCISDYYKRFHPFDGARVIGTEIRIELKVGQHSVQGFIDRLDCQDTHYFIHDYKTGGSLRTQQSLDEDRQLALYSLAIKQMFPDAEKVTLVWHFLQFDKTFTSTRSEDQLEELKTRIKELIEEVERCSEFSAKVSALCDWCEYKSICPAWKHEASVEALSLKEFKEDEGVKLVDEYARLQEETGLLNAELDSVKERLLEYAEHHGISVVAGSRVRAKIWKGSNPAFPGKTDPGRAEFEILLKNLGILEEVRKVDTWALQDMVKQHKLNPIIEQALLKKYPKKDVTRIYLGER